MNSQRLSSSPPHFLSTRSQSNNGLIGDGRGSSSSVGDIAGGIGSKSSTLRVSTEDTTHNHAAPPLRRLNSCSRVERPVERKLMNSDSLVLPKSVKATGLTSPIQTSFIRRSSIGWNLARGLNSAYPEPITPTAIRRTGADNDAAAVMSPVIQISREGDNRGHAEGLWGEQSIGGYQQQRPGGAVNNSMTVPMPRRSVSPLIYTKNQGPEFVTLVRKSGNNNDSSTYRFPDERLQQHNNKNSSADIITTSSDELSPSSSERIQAANEIQNILLLQTRKSFEEEDFPDGGLGAAYHATTPSLDRSTDSTSKLTASAHSSPNRPLLDRTTPTMHPSPKITISINGSTSTTPASPAWQHTGAAPGTRYHPYHHPLETNSSNLPSMEHGDEYDVEPHEDADDEDEFFSVGFESDGHGLKAAANRRASAIFHTFGYDGEEIENHKPSISMSAIQNYLEEYSIHDDCFSPFFVRTNNGIPFDKTFQHRNSSSFTVGSLEQLEICGVEIGLLSMSPPSQHFMPKVR